MDWDSITVAGAFVFGVVFATVAMLRIVQAVMKITDTGRTREDRERQKGGDQ